MSHSFGTDLRSRVILAFPEGLSTRKAAARFGISVVTSGEWYRRYRDLGETTARKRGQPPGSKLDTHEAFIPGLVEQAPDIGLEEIAERLLAGHRSRRCPRRFVCSSRSAISRTKKDGTCERAATPRCEGGA